jgi:hypothetical protein
MKLSQPFVFVLGLALLAGGSASAGPYQTPSAPPSHSYGGGGQGRSWNRQPAFTPGPGAVVAKPPTVRPPVNSGGNPAGTATPVTPVNASAGPEFADVEQERSSNGAPGLRSHQAFLVEGALARNPVETLSRNNPSSMLDTTASHSSAAPKSSEKDAKAAHKPEK